ncbi:hypothetical protein [Paenimyroides ceti]
MKKVFLTLALCLGAFMSASAGEPIGRGSENCGGVATVREYRIIGGVEVFFGDYLYFNSFHDAQSYILTNYPHLPFPQRNVSAKITCNLDPGPIKESLEKSK